MDGPPLWGQNTEYSNELMNFDQNGDQNFDQFGAPIDGNAWGYQNTFAPDKGMCSPSLFPCIITPLM